MKEEPQNFFIKIYLYSSWSQSFCGVWETDGRTEEDKDRLLYWPITSSSLDYCTLCYFQDSTWYFCFSDGIVNRRPLWSAVPSRALSVTASLVWLRPSLTPTDSNWFGHSRGICIHHFITPTTSNKPRPTCVNNRNLSYIWFSLIDGSVKGQYATMV